MKVMQLSLAAALLLYLPDSAAQVASCSAVLKPQQLVDNTVATKLYAYMYENASYAYDELKKMDQEARGLDIGYKTFQLEYNDSKSGSEFQQKVRNRIVKEGYSSDERVWRAINRSYISDGQVEAWSRCVVSNGGGGVVLVPEAYDSEAISVLVQWAPPRGMGSGKLTVQAANGKIDGKSTFTTTMTGLSDEVFFVNPIQPTRPVQLTAKITGSADRVVITPKEPVVKLPPQAEKIERTASQAGPLENVEVYGPNKPYGPVLGNGFDYNVEKPNAAEFTFDVAAPGRYELQITYAAEHARPVNIDLNGKRVFNNALSSSTGGWGFGHQQPRTVGRVELKQGENTLRISRSNVFPHISKITLLPVAAVASN